MTQETSTKSTPRETPYSASGALPLRRLRLLDTLDVVDASGAGFLRFRDLDGLDAEPSEVNNLEVSGSGSRCVATTEVA